MSFWRMRKYPRENELPLLAVENSGDLPPDASGTICLVARMQVKSVIFIWWARVNFFAPSNIYDFCGVSMLGRLSIGNYKRLVRNSKRPERSVHNVHYSLLGFTMSIVTII